MDHAHRPVFKAVLGALALAAPHAYALDAGALPTGGIVAAGGGAIVSAGNVLSVNQASPKLAIDWQSFNIGANATVNFVQPSSSAIALNRVAGGGRSEIYGKLNANGQVFLLNSSGILFGKSAEVNVGGLVASTLNLSNADFMNGATRFVGTAGEVTNQGSLNGNYVALLGGQVSNQGTISARLGTAVLAAGSGVTLDFAGDGLIGVQVNQGALNALAENKQLIHADGGTVILTAKAADSLIQAVVNNEGVIQARTVENKGGVIKLLGDMGNGVAKVDGTLDASAPDGGNGGFIETSAARVNVADSARITAAAPLGKAGQWLLDPYDFFIGGNGQISVAALGQALTGSDVTITTAAGSATCTNATCGSGYNGSGDITVYDAITWSSSHALTLSAYRNIDIEASITWPAGTLNLNAGTGGTGAILATSGNAAMRGHIFNLQGGTWNQVTSSLPSFVVDDFRIAGGTFIRATGGDGSVGNPYQLADIYGVQGVGSSGMLGKSYVLANDIDARGTANWNGGNGFVAIASVDGTEFTGVFDGLGHTIAGLNVGGYTGGLFGISGGTLQNLGLEGVSMSISVGYNRGGLVGVASSTSIIANCHVTGTVTGWSFIGGLVGVNYGAISNSYASTTISGVAPLGGLVADNFGSIVNSYATGKVTSDGAGADGVGGLVGDNSGSVATSYANVSVIGTDPVGALVGDNSGGTVTNSYWNSTLNPTLAGVGAGSADGVTALTATEMKTASKFAGFNFTTATNASGNNWVLVDDDGTLNNAGGAGATTPMLASEYSTSIHNAHQLQLMVMNKATGYTLASNIDARGTSANTAHAITGAAADVWDSGGFVPVGNSGNQFTGNFDGQSHTISGLTIDRPTTNDVGLFGAAGGGWVHNIGLVGGSVTGRSLVGELVGLNFGTVTNSYATGTVSGTSNGVGGLVGENGGSIADSYASVTVSGINNVGGLVGSHQAGNITGSYASGTVAGGDYVGGLVGIGFGSVTKSYASGTASGTNYVDGLVGRDFSAGDVDAYSSVQTSTNMKQLTTFSAWGAAIDANSGTGSTWRIYDGATMPLLRSFLTPLTVTANTVVKTYDGAVYGGANSVNYSTVTDASHFGGTLNYSGTWSAATHAGSYTISPSGLTSDQQGYDISYADGALNVVAKQLTATAAIGGTLTKVYDGGTAVPGATASVSGSVAGAVAGDILTLDTTAVVLAYDGGHVLPVNQTIIATGSAGFSIASSTSGSLASDYSFTAPTIANVIAHVTAKPVTITAQIGGTLTKVYDGNIFPNAATASIGGSVTGAVAGDTLTLKTTGVILAYNDAHVLTANKTISIVNGSVGVTVSATTHGSLASDYSVTAPTIAAVSAAITAAPLTVSLSNTGVAKVFDGTVTTSATPTYSFSGLASGDTAASVSGGTTSYDSAHAGSATKLTQTGLSLTGISGSNHSVIGDYSLANTTASSAANSATITKKSLTATASITAVSKVYDGLLAASTSSVSGSIASGLIGTDSMTLNTSGISLAYNNAHVATANKTIAATGNAALGTLTSAGSGTKDGSSTANRVVSLATDYTLAAQPTIASKTGTITTKTLTVTGVAAASKDYDGTRTATLTNTGSLTGTIGTETLTLNASGVTATFGTAAVGNNKTVTATGYVLGNGTGQASDYRVGTVTAMADVRAVAVIDNTPPVSTPVAPPVAPPVTPLVTPLVTPPVMPPITPSVTPSVSTPVTAPGPATTVIRPDSANDAGALVAAVQPRKTASGSPAATVAADLIQVVGGGIRLPYGLSPLP